MSRSVRRNSLTRPVRRRHLLSITVDGDATVPLGRDPLRHASRSDQNGRQPGPAHPDHLRAQAGAGRRFTKTCAPADLARQGARPTCTVTATNTTFADATVLDRATSCPSSSSWSPAAWSAARAIGQHRRASTARIAAAQPPDVSVASRPAHRPRRLPAAVAVRHRADRRRGRRDDHQLQRAGVHLRPARPTRASASSATATSSSAAAPGRTSSSSTRTSRIRPRRTTSSRRSGPT